MSATMQQQVGGKCDAALSIFSNSKNAQMKKRRSAKSDSALAIRLGKCEVCAANDARYTCPKCEVKTCCVRCVQIHKKELNCDGIRDRTKFIPLRKMTKMDFMNDYYFLEECTRFTEDRKNDRLKRLTRSNKELPIQLQRLRGAASERKIRIRFLLPHFTKHKQNTTYYDWKLRKLCWRIEWIFSNANGERYVDERCDEDNAIRVLLAKYVDATNSAAAMEYKALAYYQSVGISSLKVMLKAEGIKRCEMRFYELDIMKTLKDNLAGKIIVEYPVFFVSYEAHPAGFDIIDSDEDLESEIKAHQVNIDRLRPIEKTNERDERKSDEINADESVAISTKKRQQNDSRQKRSKRENTLNNFLFADEENLMVASSATENDESDVSDNDNGNDTTLNQSELNDQHSKTDELF